MKDLDKLKKETNEASKAAGSLIEKVELHRASKTFQLVRDTLRQHVFDVQDVTRILETKHKEEFNHA